MTAEFPRAWIESSTRIAEKAWYLRSRVGFLNFPIPWRLPYGGWFLAYGDAMGARVAGYRIARNPYEQGQWRLVTRILRSGGVLVDVGANQGFYTILASRLVGSTGAVYAFEPAPTEIRKLQRNLWLNRCHNVAVEQLAVGETTGDAPFHMYLGHQGSWSGLRKAAEDVTVVGRVIDVRITSLDEYFKHQPLAHLDVVKIDVEGGELSVLRGAVHLINRFRPVVLCEVEQRRTEQWGYDAGAILRELESNNYRWWRVTPDGRLGEAATPGGWQNLVAIPTERTTEFAAARQPA